MKNPDRIDIERSLMELSDEEAIAIMEGRAPAVDDAQLHASALTLARDVIGEPDAPSSNAGGGGNVVQLIVKQPWMRMAASLAIGVGLTILTMSRVPNSHENVGEGSASTNVVYLEVHRSADPSTLPVVELTKGEDWVSLVAYPDFGEADLLRVFVERAADGQQPDPWEVVSENTVGVGVKDAVVVNLRSDLLVQGIYRLRVDAVSGGVTMTSTALKFRVGVLDEPAH